MKQTDVMIIGAGLLGCFSARELRRYQLDVTVLEAREDICCGISRANTAIVYSGYDTKPKTLKTELCLKGNGTFDRLCGELGVRFRRCGSLMIACGPRGEEVLRKKLAQGQENGVAGLELLAGSEVLALEPGLGSRVSAGLFAPTAGIVNPWELGIAAYENAKKNGAEFRFSSPVKTITRSDAGYLIETESESYQASAVVNCAGLCADEIRELVFPPKIRIYPQKADYLVFDDTCGNYLKHVIFHEPEEKGKGLTAVPTTDGNLLIGPSEEPAGGKNDFATSAAGLDFLRRLTAEILPELPQEEIIRSFAGLRPNPFYVTQNPDGCYRPEDRSIGNFVIETEGGDAPFLSMIGIKTPGLTCSRELGCFAAKQIAKALEREAPNPDFDPIRSAPVSLAGADRKVREAAIAHSPAYGRIVCRCRGISEGEILDAIRRGATTLDGVKRRAGSGMGRCQGGYCTERILRLLSRETGVPIEQLKKDGPGSGLLTGRDTDAAD